MVYIEPLYCDGDIGGATLFVSVIFTSKKCSMLILTATKQWRQKNQGNYICENFDIGCPRLKAFCCFVIIKEVFLIFLNLSPFIFFENVF